MAADKSDLKAVERLNEGFGKIKAEIGKVIIGHDQVIEQLLIAILARGHCLFVGVPGLAKTLLISTLAKTLDLKFSRIQFTPDLMPSDITGTELIEENRTTGTRELTAPPPRLPAPATPEPPPHVRSTTPRAARSPADAARRNASPAARPDTPTDAARRCTRSRR